MRVNVILYGIFIKIYYGCYEGYESTWIHYNDVENLLVNFFHNTTGQFPELASLPVSISSQMFCKITFTILFFSRFFKY